MKVEEKQRARSLREEGKSINEIIATLGVSKGSVSLWVRDIVLTEKQKAKLSKHGRSVASVEKRRVSRMANQKQRDEIVTQEAKTKLVKVSKDDLRLIGLALYLGEGSKMKRGVLDVANSDPLVIKIMMRFFREICCVPLERFKAHIHTFAGADIEKTEKYWSGVTGIPRNQFYKTYSKQSSATQNKRRTTPFGTCSVSVNNVNLFLEVMAQIEKMKELVLKK